VDQGKGPRVEKIEAEHSTVEPLGGIQVADSDESNLLRMTEHLIGPFRYAVTAERRCHTVASHRDRAPAFSMGSVPRDSGTPDRRKGLLVWGGATDAEPGISP
jgi:hypothetical protein